MSQKPYENENLVLIVKYLNYNGPLFMRNYPEFESIPQKQPTSITTSIGI